jgi:RNA polymerase sigma-70 factor, ECF subfamily
MPEDRDNPSIRSLPSKQGLLSIEGLVEEHLGAVYAYAYRLTGTVQDAEDLTQQVFLLAQQRLEQLRQCDRARGWLFTILRNLFLKMVHQPTPVAATNVGLNLDMLPAAGEEVPLVDERTLQAAINELPPEFRLVVVMYYFEESSYRDIAEKLEMPIGTVMSRLARAKRHLRATLWQADGEPAEAKATKAQ